MISDQEEYWRRRCAAEAASVKVTQDHIQRVRELLDMAAGMLSVRGYEHDRSKSDPVEAAALAEMQLVIDQHGQAEFGSDEYERRKEILAPMLAHHYAHNSHHPEHYEDGVDGMDLFDVVEMFFDWKAASERGGSNHMGLSVAAQKYNLSPQLHAILKNTASRLGYLTKEGKG